MESNELIVCQDISLGYEGQSVLTDLNLTIRAGDYLCIVGDNGSGKSTLLRGILGLLTPQSGKILRAVVFRECQVECGCLTDFFTDQPLFKSRNKSSGSDFKM